MNQKLYGNFISKNNNALVDILQEKISKNLSNYFPSENTENYTIQTISHSFLSSNPIYIFEVNLNKDMHKKIIFAKVIPSSENDTGGKGEYEMLKTLYENNRLKRENFFVPRPLDYFAGLNTILTEKSEGIKLSNLLLKTPGRKFLFCENAQTPAFLIRRCGNGLKIIHDISATGKASLIPNELLNKINIHLNYLTEEKALNRKTKEKILETFTSALSKTTNLRFPLVKQHGDYGIGNILISGGKITVIDFTFSCEDLIYNDIGHFLMGIDILYQYPRMLFFNFRTISLFKKRFLEGYFTDLSEIKDIDWLLIHLYKIRNIIIYYRRQYDRRSQFRRFIFPFTSRLYQKFLMNEVTRLRKLI